ncbi:basic salivary proline-rich protein 2-like [Vombatus ursinus]|uniref:basic salivary proline-rich protein 2-like n=1 Tax=Vombatus ursinus TaxID=29139 RepID=UPI000FFD50EA|nr:basic salivary proline-rich protein 2-like [Vombatus ursinus]XP_027703600.1 basic salivary proline-rich protein 2-like [Vombatus ursinus]
MQASLWLLQLFQSSRGAGASRAHGSERCEQAAALLGQPALSGQTIIAPPSTEQQPDGTHPDRRSGRRQTPDSSHESQERARMPSGAAWGVAWQVQGGGLLKGPPQAWGELGGRSLGRSLPTLSYPNPMTRDQPLPARAFSAFSSQKRSDLPASQNWIKRLGSLPPRPKSLQAVPCWALTSRETGSPPRLPGWAPRQQPARQAASDSPAQSPAHGEGGGAGRAGRTPSPRSLRGEGDAQPVITPAQLLPASAYKHRGLHKSTPPVEKPKPGRPPKLPRSLWACQLRPNERNGRSGAEPNPQGWPGSQPGFHFLEGQLGRGTDTRSQPGTQQGRREFTGLSADGPPLRRRRLPKGPPGPAGAPKAAVLSGLAFTALVVPNSSRFGPLPGPPGGRRLKRPQ